MASWRQEVPVGWIPIMEQLMRNLNCIGWTGKILEAKNKFGSLRVYITDPTYKPPRNFSLQLSALECVQAAEIASMSMCEDCGDPDAYERNFHTRCWACHNRNDSEGEPL